MPVITICSSANFFRQAADVQDKLEKLGFDVLMPATAMVMKKSGDYNVDHYKTWFGDKNDYHKKTKLVRGHFDEIEKGDLILVLNYEKHGVKDYIGGNVLMEMTIAFYLNKPIFILNDIPKESPFLEEIMCLNSITLQGKLELLPEEIKKVL